jgi:hypothetical protein
MTIIIIIHNNPTTTYDDTSETSQQKMLIDIKDLDKHDKDDFIIHFCIGTLLRHCHYFILLTVLFVVVDYAGKGKACKPHTTTNFRSFNEEL